MPTYFTTDPTARVSFWETNVEHLVTGDGLTIGYSEVAEGLVGKGLLRVGEPTPKTAEARVYDPANDESLAYAAAQNPPVAEAAAEPVAEPAPAPPPPAPAAPAADPSASTSGDEPASQPTGPDASPKEKRT